jgi:Putative zinc-finger
MNEPHETATLLPWYLSGTLAPGEARAVEQHLAGCSACREEVEQLRRLRTALATTVESRPAPARDLFASVRSRIEADATAPARSTVPETPWWERFAAAIFGVLPPRMAPAAALAVIVLQLGALAVVGTIAQQALRGPGVTTQSGPVDHRPLPPGLVRLRVAFRPNAPEGEIRALLQRLEARVADGPSAAGFYIVEAPTTIGGRPVTDVLQERAELIGLVEKISP